LEGLSVGGDQTRSSRERESGDKSWLKEIGLLRWSGERKPGKSQTKKRRLQQETAF
jgi:hypothetical protein